MSGIQKISSIILWVIAGLSALIALLYFLGGTANEVTGEKNFTSVILTWSLILFIITGIATIVFSIYNIFTNPKAVKNFVIILIVAIVLIGISYLMASSEMLELATDEIPTSRTLKWVGTGLNATYLLAIVAFFGIIFSEIARAFK
ncbi:MAG: hypothetical protein JW894_00275 [Bacteroidales bacterium]|nr:hypothetical protein [Bacteroidales bacterium]